MYNIVYINVKKCLEILGSMFLKLKVGILKRLYHEGFCRLALNSVCEYTS